MTRIEFRRVVIACDAGADLGVAVAEAAALAAQWRAELSGFYVEDENLYRLAELEIVRHVGLSALASETPAAEMLKEMLPAYAELMRGALEAAALRHRLAWSFGTRRMLPSAAAFREIEGDILILDAGARPFSGDWRPRSLWQAVALSSERTVLLKRRRGAGRGTVVVAPRADAGGERLIAAAFALAPPGSDLAILSPDPGVGEVAKPLGAASDRAWRLEAAPRSIEGILARLAELDPTLLVLSAADDAATLRLLAESTRCDLLLVR